MSLLVEFNEDCFKKISLCPWCSCGVDEAKAIYGNEYDAIVYRCEHCGFVYSSKVLNQHGIEAYWKGYEAENGDYSEELVVKRDKMYDIEFEYFNRLFDVKGKKVLEVGCATGGFLDRFNEHGAICFGTEIRKPAIDIASKKYEIFEGDLSDINTDKTFNIIVFRGVIQYFIEPIKCFNKAVSMLEDDGIIYITSTPNADGLCFNLFRNRFTLPVGVFDYWGYSEKILTEYMRKNGLRLVNKTNMYEETPYSDIKSDIMRVAQAIKEEASGSVSGTSPAFYDNMLTLIYKKTSDMNS